MCPKCEAAGHVKRRFLFPDEPEPKCAEHNVKMVRQTNRPYLGKPTPE